jgi:hypothetical protein
VRFSETSLSTYWATDSTEKLPSYRLVRLNGIEINKNLLLIISIIHRIKTTNAIYTYMQFDRTICLDRENADEGNNFGRSRDDQQIKFLQTQLIAQRKGKD